jgi:steroid 5-alpha reductase family enzyme
VSLTQLTITALFVCATLSLIMTVAWLAQQKSSNSGWVDVSWSLGVGVSAVIAVLLPFQHGWPHWRQIAVAMVAAGWSLRLGLHIAQRTRAAADDPRYRDLIKQWGVDAPRRMFWFLQSQAIVGALLSLSVAIAASNQNPAVRFQDIVGLAIFITAIVGEAVADHQLATFRADRTNHGLICDVGLWSWSRHPNYFFEWLFWLAFPIIAIDFSGQNPFGWFASAAPICMYWVLVHVSGIPPLEAHMQRSRGEAFLDYQMRTSTFFPCPPGLRGMTRLR